MSLNALATDAMVPALNVIANDLGVDTGNREQLVVSIFLVANGLGCLLPGFLSDRYGRRQILLIILAAYSLISVSIYFIHDFGALLAARALQGLMAGGLLVVPNAMIRDCFQGDQMARIRSLASAAFITVSVIAPSLGQGILNFAGWRWIFIGLAVAGTLSTLWVWSRVRETLPKDNRLSISFSAVAGNFVKSLTHRAAAGYVAATTLLMGAVFGYVIASRQLLVEVFDVGALFPIVFGGSAAMMFVASIINSHIVGRYGAKRISHAGILLFILMGFVQLWASYEKEGDLLWFLPIIAINLAILAFLGSNFGAIAMQPFSHIAGAASSAQTFIRMFGAAVVGWAVGQAYDGTARPLAIAFLLCGTFALLAVLFAERGRLFRRKYDLTP